MGGEELSELIGLIYDAALDPDAWPVMLDRLADALSARCGVIGSYNSITSAVSVTAPRAGPEYLRSFTEYWARRNLILHGSSETETGFFAALIPHLQRALQLQLRSAGLDGLPEGSAEILNRLSQGIILVDGEARVIFANRAAENILLAGRGLVLARDGLRAEIPAETRRLRRIITDCAAPRRGLGGAGGRLRLFREHGLPLTVLVAPHRARFGWIDVVRPRAILFITDPEAAAGVGKERLREDFGLTPAEAAVALEVLEAHGLHAAAGRLGISLATARTHLAHVFDKTGTHRQAELVRLLLRSEPEVREDQGAARQ